MSIERRTVFLHFNRRSAEKPEERCVPWSPAEVTGATVAISDAFLDVTIELHDASLAFHGSFHIPLVHITNAYADHDGYLVIETRDEPFPRLVLALADGRNARDLADEITVEVLLRRDRDR